MRTFIAVVGLIAGLLFISAQFVFWAGTSLGVVREHCVVDSGAPRVESKWTYILFPPLFFANQDPPGTCVRNSPLREGLAAAGIWELPSPERQVADHIVSQLPAPES